jgi:hypothetical protein
MVESSADAIDGDTVKPQRGIFDVIGHDELNEDDEDDPILGVGVDALQLRHFRILLAYLIAPVHMRLV